MSSREQNWSGVRVIGTDMAAGRLREHVLASYSSASLSPGSISDLSYRGPGQVATPGELVGG